jgi:hypothetical protein
VLPTTLRSFNGNFCGGSIGEGFKFHLEVCSLILGGLGVRNLLLFNETLLRECFGVMFMGERLWKVVVDTKFGGTWNGWCSNEVYGPYGVQLWKHIRRG